MGETHGAFVPVVILWFGELVNQLGGDIARLAAVIALVITIHRLAAYLWRTHLEGMKAVIQAQQQELERKQVRIAELEERLQVRRDNEHRLNNMLLQRDAHALELADQLSAALLELGLMRDRPKLMPPEEPEKEA